MIDQIVDFLTSAVSAGVNLSGQLFNATGTWSLVFAGFSIIMISRFILGPILGFSFDGSSDKALSTESRAKYLSDRRNRSISKIKSKINTKSAK